MLDLVPFASVLGLQLLFDVVRQIAFALPVAYVWELEKNALWWREGEPAALIQVPLLITGLAAGSISVLTWPHEQIVAGPFAAGAALASVPVTGMLLSKAAVLFRELGSPPPSLFAVRDATIFALGLSLMRVAALA